MSFSVVASHRQAVAYLHWLDPEEKRFYMSYLRSYPIFEAESVRGCNNTIKNIIDNAEGPRQVQIGKALVILEPLTSSWNAQLTAPTKPPTLDASFSGDSNHWKRARGSRRIDGFCSRIGLSLYQPSTLEHSFQSDINH